MSRVGDKRTNAEDDGAQFTDEQIQALENNQKGEFCGAHNLGSIAVYELLNGPKFVDVQSLSA